VSHFGLHETNVIVWDLETVPDLAGFAAANDLVGKSDVEVLEASTDAADTGLFDEAEQPLSLAALRLVVSHHSA